MWRSNCSCPLAAFSWGRSRSWLAIDLRAILIPASYVKTVIGHDIQKMLRVSMPPSFACSDLGLLLEGRAIKRVRRKERCMVQCTDFVEVNGTGDSRAERGIISLMRSSQDDCRCIGNIGGRRSPTPMKASHVTNKPKFWSWRLSHGDSSNRCRCAQR